MDNPGYVGLARASGLARELRTIANNIANMSTDGYRRDGLVFAETLARAPVLGGALAMGAPRARVIDDSPGVLRRTGGALDLAIDGPGYFAVQTPAGPRLTRAGAFRLAPDGTIVTAQGRALLDAGGAPLPPVPPGARPSVSRDGDLAAGASLLGRVGVFAADPRGLARDGDVLFRTESPLAPAPGARIRQGFVEASNVEPVVEIARMVEIQRAYEASQRFLDLEDARVAAAVRVLGRTA